MFLNLIFVTIYLEQKRMQRYRWNSFGNLSLKISYSTQRMTRIKTRLNYSTTTTTFAAVQDITIWVTYDCNFVCKLVVVFMIGFLLLLIKCRICFIKWIIENGLMLDSVVHQKGNKSNISDKCKNIADIFSCFTFAQLFHFTFVLL